jgi:ATP-dependent Clp protease ATP-binding subunit ClpC
MFRHTHKQVRRALVMARCEAIEWNHSYLGCEHLLIGLLRTSDSTAAAALGELKIDVTQIRALLTGLVCPGTEVVTKMRLPQTPRAKRATRSYAYHEAHKIGRRVIGTEHLLLALLRDRDNLAVKLLEGLGLTPDQIRKAVMAHVQPPMKVRNDHERVN